MRYTLSDIPFLCEKVASPVVAVAESASVSSFVLGLGNIDGYWYLVLRRDHGEQVSE